MKKNKNIYISVGALTVIILIILWWHLFPNKKHEDDKDTIKIAVISDIQGFDITSPENTFSTYSNRYLRLVHDTLLEEKEGKIISKLAKLVESDANQNQDKTLLKFELRDDILFHNGENITTDDVIFTIERGHKNKHPQFEEIKAIKRINNIEFEIELKEKTPYWHFTFCNFIRILNKKAVEENEEKGLQIGTGPYKLVEYKSNDEIKMEKFNNYYNKDTIKDSPKTIIFKINKNNDTNLQQVENGSLDACLDYPSHKIQIIKDKLSHSVEVVENKDVSARYLYINKDKTSLETREAISWSLDIEKIISDLEIPAQKLKTFLPETLKGFDNELDAYPTNFLQAKKYVQKLDKTAKKLKIGCITKSEYLFEHKIIEQLRKVGFIIEFAPMDFKALLTEAKKDNSSYNMIFLGENYESKWGHKVLRDYFLTNNNPNNFCHIDNDDKSHIENKLLQVEKETSEEKYTNLLKEISQYIHKEFYVIPLYSYPNYVITSKNIKQGFKSDLFSHFDFTKIIKK